ncbi:protein PET117 [Entomortierella parvispora]|uniref:Protein PET117 n=1 Tax=Entomortierella parvispora TaxID=205924 RepID=A0A9P3M1U1_9FUNG|nr:protein PET117 [Entomortierella parvispora]
MTLAITTACTVATVYGVHYQQMFEKETMRLGVVKDEERMAAKKRQDENVLELAVQRELQKKMLEEQTVRTNDSDTNS